MSLTQEKVLTVVMDGVGIRSNDFGNAVSIAPTPYLELLKQKSIYTTLKAHGTYVGLPSDKDLGNSEVGHNALGAGRVFDQGAKLVNCGLTSGAVFNGQVWKDLVQSVNSSNGQLHLIGLLSDGNIHAHQDHLHILLERAKKDGVRQVRIHALVDGRDVGETSAEVYVDRLEAKMKELRSTDFSVQVASGGGRMTTTMDRYEADWSMVERGWKAHVLGEAEYHFSSISGAIKYFREELKLKDQFFPSFTIGESRTEGVINDGDAVVLWNFRGDRAIEISRAFTEVDFAAFDRKRFPKAFFAGMMQYDGDLNIPKNFLVEPPTIEETLGEKLAKLGKRQFACSETQKFGHVTYFWNGNRSGCFDETLEDYVEIPSDPGSFELSPWMKAREITDSTIAAMNKDNFSSGRINFANGDMVGHTGDFHSSVVAVSVVDQQIGRIMNACQKAGVALIVTADHGNCDQMFEGESTDSQWYEDYMLGKLSPKAKTSHTLSEVPFYFFHPTKGDAYYLDEQVAKNASIANVAASIWTALGLGEEHGFCPSLIRRKS